MTGHFSLKAFAKTSASRTSYIGVLGVRVSGILEKMIRDNLHMDVRNLTCTGGRNLAVLPEEMQEMEEDRLLLAYADALLGQMPCFRMNNNTRRNQLYLDPDLKGIIYHTIKFCDYYGFEYASIKRTSRCHSLRSRQILQVRVPDSFQPESRHFQKRSKGQKI